MNNYNDFTFENVTKNELYNVMQQKYDSGYRLVQICCVAYEGYNEIIYSVGKDYEIENYRIELALDDEIKSFSDIFPAAMLYENEIKELWGVKVVGIAIDYNDKFYRIEAETPFKKQIRIVNKEDEE